jgi:hypothetical protein
MSKNFQGVCMTDTRSILASPTTQTVAIGAGVASAAFASAKFVQWGYESYKNKKRLESIKKINALHEKHLKNLTVRSTEEDDPVPLPPIYQASPEDPSKFSSITVNREIITSIVNRVAQYTDSAVGEFRQHITEAMGFINAFYNWRLQNDHIFHPRKENDTTSNVLCYMLLMISEHCYSFKGYEQDICYVRQLASFLLDFMSMKQGKDDVRFAKLEPAYKSLNNALDILEANVVKQTPDSLIKRLTTNSERAIKSLMKLYVKLLMSDKYWGHIDALTLANLAVGVIKPRETYKIFFHLYTHIDKEVRLPDLIYSDWIMQFASDYEDATSSDAQKTHQLFIDSDKYAAPEFFVSLKERKKRIEAQYKFQAGATSLANTESSRISRTEMSRMRESSKYTESSRFVNREGTKVNSKSILKKAKKELEKRKNEALKKAERSYKKDQIDLKKVDKFLELSPLLSVLKVEQIGEVTKAELTSRKQDYITKCTQLFSGHMELLDILISLHYYCSEFLSYIRKHGENSINKSQNTAYIFDLLKNLNELIKKAAHLHAKRVKELKKASIANVLVSSHHETIVAIEKEVEFVEKVITSSVTAVCNIHQPDLKNANPAVIIECQTNSLLAPFCKLYTGHKIKSNYTCEHTLSSESMEDNVSSISLSSNTSNTANSTPPHLSLDLTTPNSTPLLFNTPRLEGELAQGLLSPPLVQDNAYQVLDEVEEKINALSKDSDKNWREIGAYRKIHEDLYNLYQAGISMQKEKSHNRKDKADEIISLVVRIGNLTKDFVSLNKENRKHKAVTFSRNIHNEIENADFLDEHKSCLSQLGKYVKDAIKSLFCCVSSYQTKLTLFKTSSRVKADLIENHINDLQDAIMRSVKY